MIGTEPDNYSELSTALSKCTPVLEEPATAEQHIAMMRACEADERIHTAGLRDATEKKLYHAEQIKHLLPKE